MQSCATQTERVVRRAVRRGRAAGFVRQGGLWLLIGAAAGFALVGVDRVWALSIPVWVLIVAPPAAGLAFAIIRSAQARPSLVDAAARLDESLGLRDALGNGLALAGVDDPFAELAVRDAERVAVGVDVRSAVRVRWGGAWLAWPVFCAVGVLVWMYVPRMTWGQPVPVLDAGGVGGEEVVGVAADQIRTLTDETREQLADVQIDSPASVEALESIDRLEDELRAGEVAPDEARLAASESFDQLAQEIEHDAERDERLDESVRDRLSGLERGDENELGDRLREGDFEGAREAARESLRTSPEMTDAQRERLKREFTDLADAIDRLNEQQPVDDSAQNDAQTDSPSVDDTAQQLESEGHDPDTARRLAERREQERQDSDAENRAHREMENLSDALRDAAEELNDPPRQEQQPGSPPDEQPPEERNDAQPDGEPQSHNDDAQTDEPQAQEDQQRDGDQQESDGDGQDGQPREKGTEQGTGEQRESGGDERRGSERGDQPGDATPDQPGVEQQPTPGDGPEKPGQKQPDADQPGDQPGQRRTPEPGENQGEQPEQRPGGEQVPGEQPAPGPGEEPTSEQSPDGQPTPQGQKTPSPHPGDDGAGEPRSVETPADNDAPDPTEGTSQDPTDEQKSLDGRAAEEAFPDEGRSLDEALRELAERTDQIDRQQEQSQRMRERARELLDSATPEQLEQLERWEKAMRSQETAPPTTPSELDNRATAPADLRPGDLTPDEQERERVIAEWFTDRPSGDGDRVTGEPGRRVREAADSALRAVEDQAVPVRRRELIKRVFDGVKKRSAEPSAEQSERK